MWRTWHLQKFQTPSAFPLREPRKRPVPRSSHSWPTVLIRRQRKGKVSSGEPVGMATRSPWRNPGQRPTALNPAQASLRLRMRHLWMKAPASKGIQRGPGHRGQTCSNGKPSLRPTDRSSPMSRAAGPTSAPRCLLCSRVWQPTTSPRLAGGPC